MNGGLPESRFPKCARARARNGKGNKTSNGTAAITIGNFEIFMTQKSAPCSNLINKTVPSEIGVTQRRRETKENVKR